MSPRSYNVFGLGVHPHTRDPGLEKIDQWRDNWYVRVYSLNSGLWRDIPAAYFIDSSSSCKMLMTHKQDCALRVRCSVRLGMEEQFVLRVPPSVAEHIERLLSENASSSDDNSLDLSFSEDGRSGTFVIGNGCFPASLLDLPAILESYKTYDDNVLIKTADVGQVIVVREEGDPSPDVVEYRHGITPPMRDARRRRFRREPDLNPELVNRVEKDILNIMNGGTAENLDILL
ncbi:hypothetical protein L1987_10529 [Smallanthus sonchifolius]|uniref:Uncharacterized protein n=1 Tax=Smallanthus sonchifolius TaxID=185202 RepID=A0ACB9JSC0_9ASTR|nr:hypothetical protein L1987_10529 [Smallanthus sonchifolius]